MRSNVHHGACLLCKFQGADECDECVFKTRRIGHKSMNPEHYGKILEFWGNFNVTIKDYDKKKGHHGFLTGQHIIFN